MSADLHARARELEQQAAEVRGALDEIYAQLTEDEADSFMARMAERFRDERDAAQREVTALKSRLASEANVWEARALQAEEKVAEARAVIGSILNNPTSERRTVQGSLLMLNDKL